MSTHSGVPLDVASIVGLILESVLYGISLVMFGMTMKALNETVSTKSNRVMIPAAFGFLILSTMHVINNGVRLVDALVHSRHTEAGPLVALSNVTQITYILKNSIYTCQTVLGDFVVIYRVYMVWDSVVPTILPILLLCGVATTAISMLSQFGQARINGKPGDVFALAKWVTSFFSLSLCANMTATLLLAFQIWRMDRRVAHIRTSQNGVLPIARIVVDSGFFYSAAILAALLCFVAHSNAQYIVLDMIMPIISISYYMIMIRLADERRKRTGTTSRSQTSAGGPIPSSMHMQPLQIQLNTVTDVMADGTNSDKYGSHLSPGHQRGSGVV